MSETPSSRACDVSTKGGKVVTQRVPETTDEEQRADDSNHPAQHRQ